MAHARNQAGISALMQARYENRLEIVELLREAAGDLDVFEAAALGDVARLNACWQVTRAWSRRKAVTASRRCIWHASSGSSKRRKPGYVTGADANAISPSRIAVIHSAAARATRRW